MAYDAATDMDESPVEDWANDWDWLDPQWGVSAPEIYAGLREAGVEMAFTERYGRAWMPLTHEAVGEIAYDTDHFSSFRVGVAQPDSPIRPAPPITSDPPDHHGHRRLLLPAFSPKESKRAEEPTREYCRELIAKIKDQEYADAAVDYSQDIPVHVIAEMIGVAEDDADVFRDWVHRNFQEAPKNNAIKAQLMADMTAYWEELLDRRAAEPQDDLATLIVQHRTEDGEPLERTLQTGYLSLLILAGIDTTWSGIGSGLWHFAQHDEERQRLAEAPLDDPLWGMAVEEVLRFYAPVTMARQVVADTEIAGCPIHKGDQVLLTFPAANRDPAAFEDSDTFILDRASNRHAAFGLGIHRCLGSNHARMEMLVAFQEWIKAFPDYTLDTRSETTWTSGQIRGPRNIPVKLQK